MEQSPIQVLIDRMNIRLNEPDVKTKKLAEIISIASDCRAELLEPGGHPDNHWWANQGIRDFTKIIVTANFKAHRILNPDLVMDDLDTQINEAINEVDKLIDARDEIDKVKH